MSTGEIEEISILLQLIKFYHLIVPSIPYENPCTNSKSNIADNVRNECKNDIFY